MAPLKLDDFAPKAREIIEGNVEKVLSSDEYRGEILKILATDGNVESLDSVPLIPVQDEHNNDLEHQTKLPSAVAGVEEQITTDLKVALEAEELTEGESNLLTIVEEDQIESGSNSFTEVTADVEGSTDDMSGKTSQIIVKTEDEAIQQALAAEANELEHLESILAQFQEAEVSAPALTKKFIDATKNSEQAGCVNVSVGENEGADHQLTKEALNQAEEITLSLDLVEQTKLPMQAVVGSAHQTAAVFRTDSITAEAGEEVMALGQSNLSWQEVVQTASQVKRLGESSQQIFKVVASINQIALQISLLAINAKMKAARVGEEGRDLAVVATQVGGLAAQLAAATQEIEQLVENCQRETSVVVRAMELGYNLCPAGITKHSST